jgi:predicted transposase/invertase (TIGR01784 family)
MLAPLDNGTVFKAAFTDLIVFKQFVKDIIGIDFEVGKIETEKKFKPKIGNIDISLDIFAESIDHRVIIEIQRIDYDYNFDRFLHYFLTAILELQKSAKGYRIDQTVYTVVVLTAPYRYDEKNQRAIQDEVLITSVDPRNLQDKAIEIYGHKLIFLNHHYRNDNTPANYRDWLDLFYQSIHNPVKYNLNLDNQGIRRAVELIDYDKLSPRQMHQLKVDTQRKVMLDIHRKEGRREGREVGLKEGRKEGKIEMARAMKEEGESLEKISKYSGLSIEDIGKL